MLSLKFELYLIADNPLKSQVHLGSRSKSVAKSWEKAHTPFAAEEVCPEERETSDTERSQREQVGLGTWGQTSRGPLAPAEGQAPSASSEPTLFALEPLTCFHEIYFR